MNQNASGKIIRDAVHGYIHIEAAYCEKIIDTPNFQRLKRLEQTNARPLYPSAHHDRFVHSLGTYHLGRKAFRFLKDNSFSKLKNKNLNWDIAEKSFELACLLHDVGHSPFSHTFESFYDYGGVVDNKITNRSIIKSFGNEDESKLFIRDYKNKYPKPNPHEKVSALLVLTEYYNTLYSDFGVNPFLVARMILGITYQNPITNEKSFFNCFIELLNGTTIDVDKLDYISRDQWATGHVSRILDYERLLSSMYLKKENNNFVVCFHKRAINEILTLVEIKKMIQVSMHSHHIVKYDEYVLRSAIKEVSKTLAGKGENEDAVIGKIISIESLKKQKTVEVCGYRFHLLTDDDLIYLLKSKVDKSPFAKEWLCRNYRLKPLWKTFADYKYFFKEFKREERRKFFEYRKVIAQEYLESLGGKYRNNYYIADDLEAEYNPILVPDIRILIKDNVVKLRELKDATVNQETEIQKTYFLLYFPKELCTSDERQKFIKFVIQEIKKQ